MWLNLKRQKVWGLPKELSGFNCLLHLHASSSAGWFWPSVLLPAFRVPSLSLYSLSLSNFPPLSPWHIYRNVSVSYVCPPTASDLVISTVAPTQHQISTSEVIRRQSCLILPSCFKTLFFLLQSVSVNVCCNFSLWKYQVEFFWWHKDSSVWIWLSAEKKQNKRFH